jgi:hypothetical protein
MCNKIKICTTFATAVVCVLPCLCIVNVSQMDVSKVVKGPVCIFHYMSLSLSENEKCLRQKL